MKITINSIEDTERLAQTIATLVTRGDVLLLHGDLGAGKTTFSQFFGKALGIEQKITSPTFNIIKSYEGKLPFHHMDCYRLEGAEDDLGFDEYFYGDGVTIVEWPEMIEEFLPEDYIELNLKYIEDSKREIEIQAMGSRGNRLKEQIIDEVTAY
ncbi:tRNA (adenosine(37)-N6)-threonylcarbamoyltransferase complex ATPase subunit type 1 TsaE [Macrococcus psychrotolerans]|uniref:tRNA (Adenosine(37)-N6)-threonylcarbamoyltransferase complex ATPase subunit type 1 TsaE n=1 Tax=Macrococcus psychrotolerans TaxID=3039389 RepID=A0AAU6RKJ4_9STAP|nr:MULTISPECIES: tRNA (adenosine(37)-N6)-threonylcarbamoyltransferase complex ATPase subunit type 1 TsaE [Macrococcus]QYA32625.1 tRNA (adenosine(37)-N6)-threonylcarbamoyltransferase complex ATPase subunit type 1 TsaE [Macrococcus sp. 19Msa1099]QYA37437.1 tRNA (adenosine(37)-N6)-threonylcarbamoyltransferase complex ATPase subunit type 1 TsaE [Macrococcus caseolyticus]QYA76144.1 tRNA (adenosine(37)-N6)-threonylcarbamoyltransferase complex ATPase subunit type 1 TsaE [Macrococcus caseolyticus]